MRYQTSSGTLVDMVAEELRSGIPDHSACKLVRPSQISSFELIVGIANHGRESQYNIREYALLECTE